MPKRPTRKAHLPRRDDLPAIMSGALRRARVIDATMTKAMIELAGVTREVGLWHMRFPNGGSWSFFICPSCQRRSSKLRLYDGRLVCWRCDGLLYRCQTNDKGPAIAALRARLAVRPSKRIKLELRRAVLVQRRKRLAAWLK